MWGVTRTPENPEFSHASLLSDTVEMCGGSRVLMKILNRLGIVTSTDSYDGFVTRVAKGVSMSQRQKTVWDDL